MSIIHNNHLFNKEENSTESVIVDSIRSQIINHLKDGKPTRFKDIKTKLHKHDYVIKRELDILKEKGWVIKEGSGLATRYSLNLKIKEVNEFLIKLKSTPNPDSVYYPFEFDLEEKKKRLDDFTKNIEKYNDDIYHKIDLITAALSFLHIDVTVAGEKIDGFQEYAHVPNEVALFMNQIATARALAKASSMRKENFKASDEESNKIYADTYNQEFKVIISWNPTKEPLAYHELRSILTKTSLRRFYEDLQKEEEKGV